MNLRVRLGIETTPNTALQLSELAAVAEELYWVSRWQSEEEVDSLYICKIYLASC